MSVRDALEKAIAALSIKYIYLNASNVTTSEEFDRESDCVEDKYCQYYDHCGVLTTYELASDVNGLTGSGEEGLRSWVYKYTYHAGVRLVNGELTPDVREEDVMVEIKASFDAFYTSGELLSEESAQVYGEKNVKFHIWPFWREFVQSTCGRVGLVPAIEIPVYRAMNGTTQR